MTDIKKNRNGNLFHFHKFSVRQKKSRKTETNTKSGLTVTDTFESQIYKPTKFCIQSLQKQNGWKIKLHDLVDGMKFYKKLNDIDDTYSKFTYCM